MPVTSPAGYGLSKRGAAVRFPVLHFWAWQDFYEIAELSFRENLGAEEGAMPQYEYLCKSCEKKFSTILTLAQHDGSKVKCPKCGGTKVDQQWAAFFATTSKKS